MKTFKHEFVDLPKMSKVTDEQTGQRYYITPTGNRYQSVTTCTSKWNAKEIAKWRERVGEEEANKISRKATKRGTNLHKTIEKYLLNEPANLEENVLNKSMFLKVQHMVDRLDNLKVVEGILYSDFLELAGTPDCIAEYSGDLSVIDFKTANHAKSKDKINNYFMQGAAYGKMFHEHFGLKPKKVVIIMAVESMPHGFCYIEPYDTCYDMLTKFMGKGTSRSDLSEFF